MQQAAQNIDHVHQLLQNSLLFQNADEKALALVAQNLELIKFRKSEPIILEHETNDHVYFILSGSVEVVKYRPELKQMDRLAVLTVGMQFAEFSVLNKTSKSASVFALEDCELLRLSGATFMSLLHDLPVVAKNLTEHLAHMFKQVAIANSGISYYNPDDIVIDPKILSIFNQAAWGKFQALPIRLSHQGLHLAVRDPQNRELFQFIRGANPNVHLSLSLINQNDFEVLLGALTSAYKGAKTEFATHQAVEPVQNLQGAKQLLQACALFKDFPENIIDHILKFTKEETFNPGQVIFAADSESKKLYIVQSGRVEMSHTLEHGHAAVHIATFTQTEHFSEVSLLNKSTHIFSVRAVTPTTILTIPDALFFKLLETPLFTLPLACSLAERFEMIDKGLTLKLFDPSEGLHFAKLADLLPRSIITQYEIMPLRLAENELIVGVVNAESETIYSVISRYLKNYRVRLEIIKQSDFRQWSMQLGAQKVTTSSPRLQTVTTAGFDSVKVLNKILLEGYDERASDIHIEATPEGYSIRNRIDGVLKESAVKLPQDHGNEILGRIKVLSHMDMTNKMSPQDGQLKLTIDNFNAFARVSTLPSKHGETAVLRLIRERSSVPPLAMLAPDRRTISLMKSVTETKQGVFLVTGPTGSGKSTTLYSLLKELNRVEVSIISLEDPVEMEVPGTTQVEMNEKAGLTFATALRSVLRQDPNVIMVGEIRDAESAKIAFHAAMTGHLVISTLHTNNSLDVVPRLIELGVPSATLAAGLIGASAQRLVRHICEHCRESRPLTEFEGEILKGYLSLETLPEKMEHGKGCSRCRQSGFHDRLPVIEVWQKTKSMETLLQRSPGWEDLYKEVQKQEFDTLLQFGLKMAINGLTTVEEIVRTIGGVARHNKK